MTPLPGRPRALLFDLDGTLIDTWRLYLDAFRYALSPPLGRPLSEEDIVALSPSAERRLIERVAGGPAFEATFTRFLDRYAASHAGLFDGPYRGVPRMLAEAREAGVRLALVTGKSRAAWRITEREAGLPPFDVVVTDDDVTDPKPSPDGLRLALNALRLNPAEVLFIGDSLLDGEAARAAGVPFGAARWADPPRDQESFGSVGRYGGPMLTFTTPESVLALLREGTGTASLAGEDRR